MSLCPNCNNFMIYFDGGEPDYIEGEYCEDCDEWFSLEELRDLDYSDGQDFTEVELMNMEADEEAERNSPDFTG